MIEKNKIIYLILGIGIGIIISNILNSAYPKIEYIELSDEKIIEKAGELGMVNIKDNIKIEKAEEDNKIELEKEINENENIEIIEESSKKIEDENNNKEGVKEIIIEEGMGLTTVAKLLYEKNLIINEEDFIYLVKARKLSEKINIGTYNIESNSSYTEIIKIITHRNQIN